MRNIRIGDTLQSQTIRLNERFSQHFLWVFLYSIVVPDFGKVQWNFN